ncbi:hypothetical protein NUW54_g14661 [Trametes sanguinea]|uniref:Uncharacterized protein n=1 Tax=Trametes sanguinea TaxID=158606 RepID=A0ACC1MB77_9APHY|nr:hypothetical protein NUW54_g14661 [Trametes sanguinea]
MLSKKPTTEINLRARTFPSDQGMVGGLVSSTANIGGTASHCCRRGLPEISQRYLAQGKLQERTASVDRHRAQDLDAILVPIELIRQNCRRQDDHDEHLRKAVDEPVPPADALEAAHSDEHRERAEADDGGEPVRMGERIFDQEEQFVQGRLGLQDMLEILALKSHASGYARPMFVP